MKQATRKLQTNRLSTKIILMVEIVLILSNCLFCAVSIVNSRVGVRKAIQQRMLDIANCASGSVNGDILEKLTAEDEGTEEYREIYDALAVFRDNVELEYVYGIRDEGGGRFTFTVDPTLSAPAAFGEEVICTEALVAAAGGRASVDETSYSDAWGSFYSAYSPVFDSAGKVAGIIAADFSVAWFENQLSAQTRATGLILLVTLLATVLLSLIAVAPFVRKQEQLAGEIQKKADDNEQLFMQVVRTLADAVDAKDPYTNGHSRRVSQYSVLLAQAAGWDSDRVDTLRYAALLHDIGKIGVPDSILNSPKRLTSVEYDIVKAHAAMGGDILKNGIRDTVVENAARFHHEWYNGKGYPLGLKGTEIPEEARIIAVADAFDAMSSNRVYRKACTPEHIRRELEEGEGRQFDPVLAELFLKLWDEGRLDSIIESNNDEVAELADGPSTLLREVVETFVSQSTVVDKSMFEDAPEGESTDIDSIAKGIGQSGSYNGALEVEYRQFVKLYEYISNLEKRFSHPFKLILISLDPAPGETPSYLELEREMAFMERSICQSIRNVDILTRYKKQQFLIILFGTDLAGARIAVDRVFRDYFKMNGSSVYMPSYFIAEMDGNAPEE